MDMTAFTNSIAPSLAETHEEKIKLLELELSAYKELLQENQKLLEKIQVHSIETKFCLRGIEQQAKKMKEQRKSLFTFIKISLVVGLAIFFALVPTLLS